MGSSAIDRQRRLRRGRRRRGVSIWRQIAFWLAAFVALGLLLELLGSAVTPFALGIVLGYLLDPIVQRLERLGLNRLGASLVILVVFVVVFAVDPRRFRADTRAASSSASRRSCRAMSLDCRLWPSTRAMRCSKNTAANGATGLASASPLSSEQIQKSVGDLVAQGGQWILNALRSLASGGAAVFSFLSFLVFTPVVAFYMLLDWDKMLATIDSWLPLDHRDEPAADRAARSITLWRASCADSRSSACFSASGTAIGLSLIGLDFGFLIGVLGGLLSFIPYVGSLTALVLSLGVAIVQGWPNWNLFFSRSASSGRASSSKAMCFRPNWSENRSACIRSG